MPVEAQFRIKDGPRTNQRHNYEESMEERKSLSSSNSATNFKDEDSQDYNEELSSDGGIDMEEERE